MTGLLLAFIAMPLLAGDGKYTIAVSDLVGQSIDQSTAAILSDRLRTELFKTGSITVLERGVMQDILKEQGFQQSACSSDTCMVEVGQLLGVSHMVAGTIGKLEKLYMLDIRMVEVSSGKIIYSENVDCECPIEKVVTVSLPLIAKKIARHVTNPSADTVPIQVRKEPPPALPPKVPKYGGLTVTSTPSGAQVLLNDAPRGTTPLKSLKLETGRYLIRLDMPTYKLIDDSLTIAAGKVEKREFSLEHTVTWRDSMAGARRSSLRSMAAAKQAVQADKKQTPKKNPAFKITFSLLSLAAGGAGVYCDVMVKDQITQNNRLRSEFAMLSDNSRYPEISSQIETNAGRAKSFQLSEYVLYGLAGACAAAFFISLAF